MTENHSSPPPVRRPLVAIVGRPNVGKSSLFNRLLGERRAIVEPTAGVTRDRLAVPLVLTDLDPPRAVDLMDTGGIGIVDREDLAASVEVQVQTAIHAAEVVVFLVDAREGLQLLDQQVARHLRNAGKPVVLAANKCETPQAEATLGDFARLGYGEALPVSASEGSGISALCEALAPWLPVDAPLPGAERLRVAVLGRRNVGKSSFVNAIVGEERMIVSEVQGTTRDAVDVDVEVEGRTITLVDTAGIHRKDRIANAVEFFSLARTAQALRRADVALLLLDVTQEPSRLDLALGREALDHYKPVVVVGTKRDLAPELAPRAFRELVAGRLPHLREAPVVLLSNLTGEGLDRALPAALELGEAARQRIGTGELNRTLALCLERLRFRGRGEKPRAYYATQIGASPPAFLLFVNKKRLWEREALRALARALGERLGYGSVPLRLALREREREDRSHAV